MRQFGTTGRPSERLRIYCCGEHELRQWARGVHCRRYYSLMTCLIMRHSASMVVGMYRP